MTTIKAEIIKDSIGPASYKLVGNPETGLVRIPAPPTRLTTFRLTYPRFIHQELLMHRMLTRSCASSRAIPYEKQVLAIQQDMAKPLEFRANQKGMQSGAALPEREQEACLYLWKQGAAEAIKITKDLHLFGVAKEIVNRPLEPYMNMVTVLSATEFSNFFGLRYHKDAMPELRELARTMYLEYQKSLPVQREVGEWHLPFTTEEEYSIAQESGDEAVQALIRKSTACCARTSYNSNARGVLASQEENDNLFNRLLGRKVKHSNPAEHPAKVMGPNDEYSLIFEGLDESARPVFGRFSGNFREFVQFRKTVPGENITEFNGPLDEEAE